MAAVCRSRGRRCPYQHRGETKKKGDDRVRVRTFLSGGQRKTNRDARPSEEKVLEVAGRGGKIKGS